MSVAYSPGHPGRRGYLARPDVAGGAPAGRPAGRWPGVVVIHEALGVNDDIRRKADQFAAHGYLALAPDLYEGKPWVRCIRGAFRQVRDQAGRRSRSWTRPAGTWRRGLTAPAGPGSRASASAAGSRCCARPGTASRRPR